MVVEDVVVAEAGGEEVAVEGGVVVVDQEDEKFTRQQCPLNCYMIVQTLCKYLEHNFFIEEVLQ